jgi:isopentenyl-diphosphate delta-isomerase
LYQAPSCGDWGEHEVDYILFLQKDLKFVPNENEVMAIRYVTQDELRELFEQAGMQVFIIYFE